MPTKGQIFKGLEFGLPDAYVRRAAGELRIGVRKAREVWFSVLGKPDCWQNRRENILGSGCAMAVAGDWLSEMQRDDVHASLKVNDSLKINRAD